MIRVTADIDVSILEGLEAWVSVHDEEVADAVRTVHQRYEGQFLHELRYTPPPAKKPIQWTSERQRRAFFATNGFGHGIPYRRTGRMQQSWQVNMVQTPTGAQIKVVNPLPYTKFVVGTLAKDVRRALIPMQRFHRNTGWQPVSATVAFWLEGYMDEFIQEYDKRVGQLGTVGKPRRRAHTS